MASTSGIRAGRAFVEIGVNDRLSAGLRAAQKRLQLFSAGVRQLGLRFVGLGTIALAPLAAATRIFLRAGDELDKISRRTGITVEALSELGFAAEQSGSDLASFERSIKTMQRAITDLSRGLATQVDSFTALGISINDLQGLSPEKQFKIIAEQLSKVENATLRAALASQIFGRAGTQLLPLIEDGAAGIEKLQQQARSLGLTISTTTAKDAARLSDALNVVRSVLRITASTVGSAFAPALETLASRVTRIVVVTNDWIKQNRAVVVSAAKIALGVIAFGSALLALSLALALIGAALGGLATIVASVSAVVGLLAVAFGAILSPVGLVVAAVVGAGFAFLRFGEQGSAVLDFLRDRFGSLAGVVARTLGGIRDALAAGDIALAARVLWAGLKLTFLEGTKEIRETFSEGLLVMRLAFVETLGTMSRLWTQFASGIQGVWERTQNFLAKRFTELFGLFDASLDVEAAKANLDAQSRSKLESLASETENALKRISDEQDARTRGVLDGAADRMEERRKELDKARRELDEAIDEARRRREETDAGAMDVLSLRDRLSGVFDDVSEMVARRIETRGTFNALAIQGLASSNAAVDRTALATEQTARNTRRLLESARSGGLTFE